MDIKEQALNKHYEWNGKIEVISRVPVETREALSLAEEAFSAGEVPVGAVVVKDGKVIGRGRNRREEHQSVLGHAELEAMEQATNMH